MEYSINMIFKSGGRKVNLRAKVFGGCKRTNHIVAIGASTGGIKAVKRVMTTLPSNFTPIVITIHIPKTFSARFAERMNNYYLANM